MQQTFLIRCWKAYSRLQIEQEMNEMEMNVMKVKTLNKLSFFSSIILPVFTYGSTQCKLLINILFY